MIRLVATSIVHQRRGLVIAVAAVSLVILLWVSLSSGPLLIKYTLPALADSRRMPITFSSHSRLLPFRYWNHRSKYPERYTDNSCMKFPNVSGLQYASSSWQLLKFMNGNVYVYGAYYDNRFEEPLVRIFIYTDVTPAPKLYCQLWYPNDNEPQTQLAEALYCWQPDWGGPTDGVNEPYILNCKCRRHHPDVDLAPVAAAVVNAPCGVATNVLDIQNAPFNDPLDVITKPVPSPRNGTSVAVCMKWLHFRTDVSVSVIEWMQLMKHFGADKVYLYIIKLHPNTRKVLKYYEDTGFAVVTELSHPPQVSGFQQNRMSQDHHDMRRELLPLNDCLYRSIGKHDWLAAIDLDEIIVPTLDGSWPALIDKQKAVLAAESGGMPVDALVFPNYFVLDGAQRDLEGPVKTRILSHTWREEESSPPGPGYYMKSFINVSSVTAMHNHTPMSCKDYCRKINMENGAGKLLHYREKCAFDLADCEALHDVVKEDNLDRWRAPVLAEIRKILYKLGLEPLE